MLRMQEIRQRCGELLRDALDGRSDYDCRSIPYQETLINFVQGQDRENTARSSHHEWSEPQEAGSRLVSCA